MHAPSVLIAGSGYVGGRLADRLLTEGKTVWALRRSPVPPKGELRTVQADLGNPRSLDALPASVGAVVFAAGPSSPDEPGYREIFIDGLGNLIRALESRELPPARLIFTSSTAVYGQSEGEWVDEDSPTEPPRFNGRVLLEAEALVHASSIPGCVLRLGGIYGPGRTRKIEQVRRGLASLSPGPPHYTNRIHRDDAAGALAHLLALERVESTYLGVDGEPAAENDVVSFLAAELGLPPPPVAQGAPARRAGSKRCRNDRLVTSGYRFVYPGFRDGYRALLAP